jgi:hypothetical protein
VRNLPLYDIPIHLGLNSFYNPETQVGGGFSALSNMDGNREYRALTTIGGSSVATASVTDNIMSGHYFEYIDFDRTRKRKTLWYTDAGSLYIGDASSPTSLSTGITRATTGLRSAVTLNQLYLTSPALTLATTGGFRYDGTNLRNWGVRAPGDEWEEEEALDSLSNVTDENADGTGSLNSSNFLFGAASVQVDKDGTSNDIGTIKVTHVEDWSSSTRNSFRFFFYLPPDARSDGFETLRLDIGDDPYTEGYVFLFDVGDMVVGWNQVVISKDDATELGTPSWAAVEALYFTIGTETNGDTVFGCLVDSFQRIRHDGFPTLAVGAAGVLTGDYRYRVSYVAEDGTESNLGPVSGTVTLTADQCSLSDIPTSADAQVVARRLYRDKDGDAVFKLVATIPDNTTTSYTDNTADAALGGAVGPIAGDDLLDNTPPTRFSAVCVHQGRVFGVDAAAPNTVWPSDIGVPGAFPIAKQLTFDDTIVAMVSQQSGLMLYGTDHAYLLTGDGTAVSPWVAVQLSDQIGADTYRSVCTIRNFNLTVHERRAYLYEDVREPWYISGPVQDQLDAYDAEDIFVVHDVKRARVLFFVDATNVAFAYNYGSKALSEVSPDGPGIDPFDPRGGVWSKITFPASYSIRCAAHIDSSTDVSRLAVGCDDAKAYFIGEDDYSWATTASTEAVAASFTSHAFPLGVEESTGGRGEPRYLRLDAVGTGASTSWTFTINLLHDPGATAFATVNLTATVPVGQTTLYLPIPPVGRASWVSVSASCSSSTGRAKFRRIRLYYMPRSKFRGAKES